jgi:hypothetical protein
VKKLFFVLLAVAVVSSGCTGSFNLTKQVYSWHRGQENKWSDEVGFLACALTPIYGLSLMADAVLLNSIEFWTGENPVKSADLVKAVKESEAEAEVTYDPDKQQLKIFSRNGEKENPTITLERNRDVIYTKDENGKIIYTTMRDDNGQVLVFNQGMEVVKKYLPAEVKRLGEKYSE